MTVLLSNEHRITEKRMMEFQPFGIEADGTPIRDLSGVVIRADMEYMEDYVGKIRGKDAARCALEEVARLLNERIPDQAYHVTPEVLRNPWNSYSAEFSAFTAEFCIAVSGDPDFLFNMGRYKSISPIIQALGKPFSVARIYKMSAYFAQRYAKDSFFTEAIKVSDGIAIVQMRLSERTYRQFGLYRRACAEHWCHAHKGYFVGVPEMFHGLSPASITDRRCIAQGDDYCEWEITWSEKKDARRAVAGRPVRGESPGAEQETVKDPSVKPQQQSFSSPSVLLSKDRPITEKGMMEFQPFGVDRDGTSIRDLSGVTIRACVDYLEDYVARTQGPAGGRRAVEEVARRLNERIPDRGYHVTADFLRNPWNSYSFEFSAFLSQFCSDISGGSQFQFNMAREKAISPSVQVLGRPFSVPRIYKMSPYFARLYSGNNGYSVEAVSVSDRSAVLRMHFGDRARRHFGRFLKACAAHWCHAHKGYLVAVPEKFHRLAPASIFDRACIAEGDPYCEWEVTWPVKQRALTIQPVIITLARRVLREQIEERERLIEEQFRTLDARHVELQEAYVQQQQITAELQRRVAQLTTLHDAGLVFASILDRETLIDTVLQTITKKLHYDRAMLKFFDPDRQATYDARTIGLPAEIADFARSLDVPVTDPDSPEGKVLLRGEPILIVDIQQVLDRLHPLYQQLAIMTQAKSIIIVPLKVKNKVLGSLTVDRAREQFLTEDDLSLMVTLASQVAIALDNTNAYRQIEELIAGLEAKVRERTAELERLNGELKTANEQLHELDRVKSEFFANISHELRTPLTLSLGAFQALQKQAPNAEAEKLIHAGLRNTSRLVFMITEFLDLAKFDSGLMELKKQCIDFAALVRAVAANFESAERRRIHLRGTDTALPFEADPRQLKKVLFNLFSNAFKFSDPDTGQVWLRLSSQNDWVELEVEDNGIGIPRDKLGCIFDRFMQVESSTTRRYEGTGIGLALAKEIVTAHGGKISVESRVGWGSTFTVSLPAGAASPNTIVVIEDDESSMLPVLEEKEPARAGPAVPSPAGGDRPLVLVADDNADMRGYLARLLSGQYRIVLAQDGVEALTQVKTFRPDLIITDVMMPRMSGYDLLQAIRNDNALRATPVIILTARVGTEARVQSLQAGADDYVAKPFDEHEILARVNNLIRFRVQERELMELQKEKLTRFLPASLAELILADRADEVLKSHRAEITVVFIDLCGFTTFAETAEPEDVLAVLQEYQTHMGQVIAENHGTIERYSGDAMMIFLNDPVPVPNHVEQAVRMAIAMRNRMEHLRRGWSQRGIELGAGIGIATGYATLGLIGFEKRKDYAAIGSVTNLAARLCSEAQHGQIFIPERVLHLVRDLVCIDPVGNLKLKGFHKPVPTYNVTGLAE